MTTKVICDYAWVCPEHVCSRYWAHDHSEACDVDFICPVPNQYVKCVPVKEDDHE